MKCHVFYGSLCTYRIDQNYKPRHFAGGKLSALLRSTHLSTQPVDTAESLHSDLTVTFVDVTGLPLTKCYHRMTLMDPTDCVSIHTTPLKYNHIADLTTRN